MSPPAQTPTLSGLVLSQLDWRWLFLLSLPLVAAALLLGRQFAVDVLPRHPVSIDALSPILSAFAFGGLVLGLSSVGDEASLPAPSWLLGAIGVVALAAFVRRQLRLQRFDGAFLDLRAFRSGTFVTALSVMAGCMVNLLGTLIVLPMYFQSQRGLDVLTTGLLLLPGGFMLGGLAPVVGRLFDRYGPRPLVPIGAAVSTCGLLGLGLVISPTTPAGYVVGLHVLMSVGISGMLSPLFATALGALPRELHAHGSALLGTMQQLAGAAGIALYVTIISTQTDATDGSDLAVGIRSAFLSGTLLAALTFAGSLLLRRGEASAQEGQGH